MYLVGLTGKYKHRTQWANNGASDRHIHWTLELQWTEVEMLAFKSLLNINEMIMNMEKTVCTQ